jgi:hypothetical protein
MAIKNWTITAEGTKSASAREHYFHDKKHKNHKHTTTAYLDIFGNVDTTLNIIRNTERYKLEAAKKAKGGRPPNEAAEFVLTFPKDLGIRPTKEQWKKILGKTMNDAAAAMGVKRKVLEGICRAVVHQQDQELKGGTGDHMHVMIGKFTDDGVYLRKLQSKSTLYAMKKSFNLAALDVLGVNHATYEPVKPYKGVAKNRVPKWVSDAAKVRDKLKSRTNTINRAHRFVSSEIKENKELEKALARFSDQSQKWLKAFENQDVKQMNRQHNRLEKSIETIGDLNSSVMNDDDIGFNNKVINIINSNKDKDEQALPTIKPVKSQPKMGM